MPTPSSQELWPQALDSSSLAPTSYPAANFGGSVFIRASASTHSSPPLAFHPQKCKSCHAFPLLRTSQGSPHRLEGCDPALASSLPGLPPSTPAACCSRSPPSPSALALALVIAPPSPLSSAPLSLATSHTGLLPCVLSPQRSVNCWRGGSVLCTAVLHCLEHFLPITGA